MIARALADPQRAQGRISQQAILQQLGISRQAHHQQLAREHERAAQEALTLELVRAVRQRHPQLGARKLLFLLQPLLEVRGYRIGRDHLFDLLRRHDLLVPRRRRGTRTSWPGYWRCENLLATATLDAPQQAWVADITYLLLADGFAYLALITDAYSRFIVGFDVSRSLAVEGCERALQMALAQRQGALAGLIHHSDHGVQYGALRYRQLLGEYQIRSSMGAVGNCYENALAERVNGILKLEYGLAARFDDLPAAQRATKEAIHLYNYERPHLSLAYQTPAAQHGVASCRSPLKEPLPFVVHR